MATNNAINTSTNQFLGLGTQSITGTVGLTSAAFYNLQVCTGSTAYSVTLPNPSGNSGELIYFTCQTTSYAIVTLLPYASETIAGFSTFPLGSYDGVWLECDGTNWWATYGYLQPYSFLGIVNNVQSIPASAQTQIIYQTGYDTSGFYNATTGLLTPLLPGKYCIMGQCQTGDNSAMYAMNLTFFKNATAIASCTTGTTANTYSTPTLSQIVAMNGSTDYLSGYITQGAATSKNLTTSAMGDINYFAAYRISNL